MPLLRLSQAARSQDSLCLRSALKVRQLQHVDLNIGHVTRQGGQNGQYLLHQAVTVMPNSSCERKEVSSKQKESVTPNHTILFSNH